MEKSVKFCRQYLILVFIISFLFVSQAEASSFGSGLVNFFNQTANIINTRISDFVHYLVLQKKYIFDNFSDPNVYKAWTISTTFNETINNLTNLTGSSTAIINVATTTKITGRPIPVNTPTVPNPKPILIAPPVTEGNVSIVPGLIINSTTTVPVENEISPVVTVSGRDSLILKYTNEERQKKSLDDLVPNYTLDEIAAQRVDDLFTNQYFEHDSPDGKSAPDLAKEEGYQYLLIGENLALGNFAGDKGIVEAWMDSAGHRANILNGKYKELGVSQRRGNFNGNQVTIAVQIFAKPLADCSKPNPQTQILITNSTASIKELQAQAKVMYETLDNLKNNPTVDKSYYNQKIQEYNYFAKNINEAVINLKNLVDQYNLQVSQYNSCIYR